MKAGVANWANPPREDMDMEELALLVLASSAARLLDIRDQAFTVRGGERGAYERVAGNVRARAVVLPAVGSAHVAFDARSCLWRHLLFLGGRMGMKTRDEERGEKKREDGGGMKERREEQKQIKEKHTHSEWRPMDRVERRRPNKNEESKKRKRRHHCARKVAGADCGST